MNISSIKKDFPILERKINGKKLVYLDNAATSQKPKQVISAVVDYYSFHNSNVHRGIHTLSEEATEMYEGARRKVAEFIGAKHPEEIIFTKGTTESLNRVAVCWVLNKLKKGDIILTTEAEHHSNLIPWQEKAKMAGAELQFVNITNTGGFDFEDFKKKMTTKVKFVAVSQASNVLGSIFPVKEICSLAHKFGAVVCVDGAQAIPHLPVNMQSLGCDFYAFSGHKMLGPMGIGVLYARKELLGQIALYEYGGGMIKSVSKDSAVWADIPERFEAGTPNVGGAVGLASAIDYLNFVGMEDVRNHEIELNEYALKELARISEVNILGSLDPVKRTGLVSFTVGGIHSHDVAAVLNTEGVAVRSGFHCAEPLHKRFDVEPTVRASYYLYNAKEDIDTLVEGVKKAIKILGKH